MNAVDAWERIRLDIEAGRSARDLVFSLFPERTYTYSVGVGVCVPGMLGCYWQTEAKAILRQLGAQDIAVTARGLSYVLDSVPRVWRAVHVWRPGVYCIDFARVYFVEDRP